MVWTDLEKSFVNAWALSLSKVKLILGFISLILCGILFVFFSSLSIESGPWVRLSLIFMPILLSLGVCLSFGVLFVKMYMRESQDLLVDLKKLVYGCFDIAIGTSYLSLPPVFTFICLWIVLGVFILLKQIPLFGPFLSVVLAFVPFLLVLCSLLLGLFGVGLLFFVVPSIAHRSIKRVALWRDVKKVLQKRPFQSLLLFVVGLLPVLFMGGFLSIAWTITNSVTSSHESHLLHTLEWFFVMIPICALLTLPVIFFFNFAAESYQLLRR